MILALETSCDETAAALLDDGQVRANVVASQAELHARYGGVVPEVASRRHLELVVPVVREALDGAEATLADVDAVAVTQGPGLIGALLVGVSAAKALAWARGLPLTPVDHLHGHVASLYVEPESGELVGYLVASRYVDAWHVMNIAVARERRRHGVGSTLLQRLFELTSGEGRRGYTLEVRVSNAEAIHVYEKLGFRPRGIRRGYYTDNREDALIMWKDPVAEPVASERAS